MIATLGVAAGDMDHTRMPDEVCGREVERAAFAEFLRDAIRSGGAFLLVGEPGIGKTALLDDVARFAAESLDALVLRASGAEFEAEYSFAGLNQLMLPVVTSLESLPEPDRAALSAALGMGSGPAPSQLVLATTVVSWLRSLADHRPVVVIFDDLQWTDRASVTTLSLVARRLSGLKVAMVFAQRSGFDSFLESDRIPTLHLGPLSIDAADALLRASSPRLHPAVRRRIIAEAAGNPLALVELPRTLSEAQESGEALLPAAIPLSDRLQRVFAARVAALPDAPRGVLLLAALNGAEGVPLRPDLASDEVLSSLEKSGLVRIDTDTQTLRFRHPLVRAATVGLASAADRREAHRTLAALTDDPYLRAVHLGETALGFDDDAARSLTEAALTALQRGDVTQATSVLTRAAALTSDPARRAQRLAESAYIAANVSGSLVGASAMLARARIANPDAASTLYVVAAAASYLVNSDGAIDTAHRMLVAALDPAVPGTADSRALDAAVTTLMVVCTFGGRPELWEPFDAIVRRFDDRLPRAVVIGATTFADPARATPDLLEELDQLIEHVDIDRNPVHVLQVALAGQYVDRIPRNALEQVITDARAGGAIASGISGLIILAADAFFEGRWSDAERLADECITISAEHGYRTMQWGALNTKLMIAAARGDDEYLETMHDEVRRWAIPRRALAVRTFTAGIDALAALATARFDDAFEHIRTIAPPGSFPRYGQLTVWSVLDVVEAAVASGHLDEARLHTRAAIDLGLPAVSRRLRFLCDAAQALVSTEDAFPEAFQAVIADPESQQWPFHLARVELAYGDRLRRARRMGEARPHLDVALDMFEALGADAWQARAANSLRSTGRVRRRTETGGVDLTEQEREVARLAASGLTNKEIGERLYLSSRTVGGHLYRLFPKLQITTRAALADALRRLDDEQNMRH